MMKFTISSGILQKQLAGLSGVIPGNPVMPILENFLFEIHQGKLIVSASDLQVSMTAEIEVETSDTGSVAVPAKHFLDTLKSLPEQPVVVSIEEESHAIEIKSYNGRYKLTGEQAEDFPKIPTPDGNTGITISSEILANAINNTIFAVGSDELRPAMTGLYLQLSDQLATFVATDGNRLVKYQREDMKVDEPTSLIIPKKALGLLKNTLPQEIVDIKGEFNSSNAFFSFDNIHLVCRLIDEKFPDYQNAIPLDNSNILSINRSEMLGSLKRLGIYANKTTNQVKLKLDSLGSLQIFAEDLEFANEAQEQLACEYEGDDLEIGFNVKLLIEMLGNLHGEQVRFSFSSPNKAGLLTPNERAEEEEILMLIMPVMLSTYAAD